MRERQRRKIVNEMSFARDVWHIKLNVRPCENVTRNNVWKKLSPVTPRKKRSHFNILSLPQQKRLIYRITPFHRNFFLQRAQFQIESSSHDEQDGILDSRYLFGG